MAAHFNGGEAFAKSTRTSKQIYDAKCGWQIKLLTNYIVPTYTYFRTETRSHLNDIVNQQTRSRMMSGIKGKNTKPEVALRRALHAFGFRFRLNSRDVYGMPDIVLPNPHYS
jgi:hypothetical protein